MGVLDFRFTRGGDFDFSRSSPARSGLSPDVTSSYSLGNVEGFFEITQVASRENRAVTDGEGDPLQRATDGLLADFRDNVAAVNLTGGAVGDVLLGGLGDDRLAGDGGDDVLAGSAGADSHNGGAGIDRVSFGGSDQGVRVNLLTGTGTGGEAEGDTYTSIEGIIGSDFADILIGNRSTTTLAGGGGADRLAIFAQPTTIDGGGGIDTLIVSGGATVSFDDNSLTGVERMIVTNGGSLDLSGVSTGFSLLQSNSDGNRSATIRGSAGDDFIRGGTNSGDRLHAGDGDDTVRLSSGVFADGFIDGGDGTRDRLILTGGQYYLFTDDNFAGFESVLVESGVATISQLFSGDQRISVFGGVNATFIATGGGNDVITGGNGRDIIEAGQGNNVIFGRGGDDDLSSGSGDDIIKGDAGDDNINGGGGADRLFGGTGSDTFIFDSLFDTRNEAGEVDEILDFGQGDTIDLGRVRVGDKESSEGSQGLTFIGTNAFTGAGGSDFEVRVQQRGNGNSILQFDVDNDGTSDFSIVVHTSVALTSDNVIVEHSEFSC